MPDENRHNPNGNDNDNAAVPTGSPSKPRRHIALRIAKWVGITVLALALLVVAILGVGVWVLTPERLTPLVEKTANKYLDATVSVKRVELTYWKSFPRLEVEVDSLTIVSHSLRGLTKEERALLPAAADSLLSVEHFAGKVDIPALIAMNVKLKDLKIRNPRANIVVADSLRTNFDIFPKSQEADTASTSMPDITLNRFNIEGGLSALYFSQPDTIDLRLEMRPSTLEGEKAPVYDLTTGGNVKARIGSLVLPQVITFGFNGDISWRSAEPEQIAIDNATVEIGPLAANLSTAIDFSDILTIQRLKVEAGGLDVTAIMKWLPAEYTSALQGLQTDMRVSVAAETTTPWQPSSGRLPGAAVSLDIPPCKASYQEMTLDTFELLVNGQLDGNDLDASTVEIEKLVLAGEGVDINFKGSVTDLLRDPLIQGKLKSGIRFAKIPSAVKQMLPFTLQGVLSADATMKLRPSYLDRLNFHRINIDGDVNLDDFRLQFTDSTGDAYLRHAQLKFGSSSTFTTRTGQRVDSLLTATLTVDTVAYDMDGMVINGSQIKLGAGISNKAASADTNVVVPLGMRLTAERLRYTDTVDSSRVSMKKPRIFATVKRYKDSAKRPLMIAGIQSERLRYGSTAGRVTLTEPTIKLQLHPNARPRMNQRMAVVYDSLQALHPNLRGDSLLRLTRAEMRLKRHAAGATRQRKPKSAADSTDRIDFGVDRETRSLLRWWNASGSITAKKGRVLTPYFPLRNRISDLDITFNMDSLRVRDLRLKTGRSNMRLRGNVTNITNAMLRKSASLNAQFLLEADTLDINQLADAAFLGAAYAERADSLSRQLTSNENASDDQLQKRVDATAADSVSGPLLVPMNIEAAIGLRANVALYEGLTLHDLQGKARIHDGALRLREVGATTDAGSIAFNALYSAPTQSDMELGIGLVLKNFYIEKFAKLFPALDSIMPALNTMSGRIQAEMAATTQIEPNMDVNLPSLSALLTIRGDSLVVIDPDVYKSIAKWLLFKDKQHNMIDSISTQIAIENSQLEIYPFIFNFDRYKLGVMGNNDLAMNLNYHVSVLKSPIPFKFGINIKGTPEHMKIRLGGAKVKDNMVAERVSLVSDTRVNLVREMDNVIARGVRQAKLRRVQAAKAAGALPDVMNLSETDDTISAADSAIMIKEGLLPAPPPPPSSFDTEKPANTKRKRQ